MCSTQWQTVDIVAILYSLAVYTLLSVYSNVHHSTHTEAGKHPHKSNNAESPEIPIDLFHLGWKCIPHLQAALRKSNWNHMKDKTVKSNRRWTTKTEHD